MGHNDRSAITKKPLSQQEIEWAGEFGDRYIDRNNDPKIIRSNISFFMKVLIKNKCLHLKNILEFGCNIGLNILALDCLFPNSKKTGVEINRKAYNQYATHFNDQIMGINCSIKDFYARCIDTDALTYDLVFTKGVLIHVNPNDLQLVYQAIYEFSNRFILLAEYYNPTPVIVNYRKEETSRMVPMLWKRDFAGEMMGKYSDLKLIDYGFIYHLDTNPQDDVTWFLLEK